MYNEDEGVVAQLDRIFEAVCLPCEVLAVFDAPEDRTVPYLEKYADGEPRLLPTLNTYGCGPARAIKYGVDNANAPVVVVTMADGSDDAQQIDRLARLVERGITIAAASRYMRGGQQVGGPPFKSLLSRIAGNSLHWMARVGTHDATNSFKAYDVDFVRQVGIDSDSGFEVGIELIAKAKRLRRPIAELPTIWLDRTFGTSNFQLRKWVPRYLRWYFFAFGSQLTVEQIKAQSKKMVT